MVTKYFFRISLQTRHLHTKLQTLGELLSKYKFLAITIHEEVASEVIGVSQ